MALPNGNMEIVFSFDTTGSMSSCLDEVRGRVSDMVQRLQADIPGIKMSIFAHGDYCDAHTYVTKHVDLTDDITALVNFAKTAERTGGGDSDECYELVLHEVRTLLSWTPGTQRALVMIGDCRPHEPDYPQNKEKLDWRKEADALGEIGVRIYSVQCANYSGADQFYADIADRTGGQHLKLSDFKNIFDFLMTVCYREKGDDLFHTYEKEVRARAGTINKDLDKLFGDLRDKTTTGTSVPSTTKAKTTSSKTISKTSTTIKLTKAPLAKTVSFTMPGGKAKRAPRPKRVSPGKAGIYTKYMDQNLPKLRRENVPECNFMLREMKWSSWQNVISPTVNIDLGISRTRRGVGCGFRVSRIFDGKTKVPALYEVAVQTKERSRKYVLYSRLCKRGFLSTGNWEKKLLGRSDIRAQVDKVVSKKCNIFIRRVVLKGQKANDKAKHAQQRYDYAWKAVRTERKDHRAVTKTEIDISEPMEM